MTLSVTFNGTIYSDNGAVGKGMSKGRWRDNWFPMLQDALTDFSKKHDETAGFLALAQKAAETAGLAASTVVTGPGSNATSSTQLTMGVGVQNLIIQPGKTLPPGAPIGIAMTAAPRNSMFGTVDSYDAATGALQVRIKYLELETPGVLPQGGAWTVFLCGTAGVTGVLNELKGDAIASAAVIDLNAATGNYLHLTGNAAVSTVLLVQGATREVTLDGNASFVHGPNLLVPTFANIQGAPGDVVRFRGEGGNVVRIVGFLRGNGKALVSGFVEMTVSGYFQPVPGASYYFLDLTAGGASGGASLNGYMPGSGGAERIQRLIPASAVTSQVLVLVGSGGTPVTVTSGAAAGNNGGDTSFGNFVTAHGGKAPPPSTYGGNGGGVLTGAGNAAVGQVGGFGTAFAGTSAEWGGAAGGGLYASGGDIVPSEGGSSIYGGAGSGAVTAVGSVPGGKPGGKSGSGTAGGGGQPGTSSSRNGKPGNDATSIATSGDGGGPSYYTGANNVGGDGGFPGGAGGPAVSSSGTATSGAGKPGVARIYWW